MHPPRDYPVDFPTADTVDLSKGPVTRPLTFAELKDRHAARLPITEDMIREARIQMESAQPDPVSFLGA